MVEILSAIYERRFPAAPSLMIKKDGRNNDRTDGIMSRPVSWCETDIDNTKERIRND